MYEIKGKTVLISGGASGSTSLSLVNFPRAQFDFFAMKHPLL